MRKKYHPFYLFFTFCLYPLYPNMKFLFANMGLAEATSIGYEATTNLNLSSRQAEYGSFVSKLSDFCNTQREAHFIFNFIRPNVNNKTHALLSFQSNFTDASGLFGYIRPLNTLPDAVSIVSSEDKISVAGPLNLLSGLKFIAYGCNSVTTQITHFTAELFFNKHQKVMCQAKGYFGGILQVTDSYHKRGANKRPIFSIFSDTKKDIFAPLGKYIMRTKPFVLYNGYHLPKTLMFDGSEEVFPHYSANHFVTGAIHRLGQKKNVFLNFSIDTTQVSAGLYSYFYRIGSPSCQLGKTGQVLYFHVFDRITIKSKLKPFAVAAQSFMPYSDYQVLNAIQKDTKLIASYYLNNSLIRVIPTYNISDILDRAAWFSCSTGQSQFSLTLNYLSERAILDSDFYPRINHIANVPTLSGTIRLIPPINPILRLPEGAYQDKMILRFSRSLGGVEFSSLANGKSLFKVVEHCKGRLGYHLQHTYDPISLVNTVKITDLSPWFRDSCQLSLRIEQCDQHYIEHFDLPETLITSLNTWVLTPIVVCFMVWKFLQLKEKLMFSVVDNVYQVIFSQDKLDSIDHILKDDEEKKQEQEDTSMSSDDEAVPLLPLVSDAGQPQDEKQANHKGAEQSISFLSDLSDHKEVIVAQHILPFLDPKTLANFMCVSKGFFRMPEFYGYMLLYTGAISVLKREQPLTIALPKKDAKFCLHAMVKARISYPDNRLFSNADTKNSLTEKFMSSTDIQRIGRYTKWEKLYFRFSLIVFLLQCIKNYTYSQPIRWVDTLPLGLILTTHILYKCLLFCKTYTIGNLIFSKLLTYSTQAQNQDDNLNNHEGSYLGMSRLISLMPTALDIANGLLEKIKRYESNLFLSDLPADGDSDQCYYLKIPPAKKEADQQDEQYDTDSDSDSNADSDDDYYHRMAALTRH